jgi:hypothetical protein
MLRRRINIWDIIAGILGIAAVLALITAWVPEIFGF